MFNTEVCIVEIQHVLPSPPQAGTQFKTSLGDLMTILMSKEPSYIRCIKPNDHKQPSEGTSYILMYNIYVNKMWVEQYMHELTVYMYVCVLGRFEEKIVRHQVKYLGLMENLRVRRAGFCYRRRMDFFLQRYVCMYMYVCTLENIERRTYKGNNVHA